MPQIVFTSTEPQFLALAILSTAITVYFLTVSHKTRELRLLLGAFSCWAVYFWLWVYGEAVYRPVSWYITAGIVSGMAGLALFVGFAYRFLGNPYPRESRVALALASIAIAGASCTMFYQLLAGNMPYYPVGSGVSLLLFVWAEGVFARRWFRAASVREGSAHAAFAVVFFLSACAVGVYFVRDVGGFAYGMGSLISSLLYLCTLVGFTLAYVNNAPRPTTFQVKIVGLSLFTVLAVLSIVSTAVAVPPAGETLRAGEALRLTPEDDGRYRVDPIPARFDPVLGDRVEMQSGIESPVALKWPFRFYGREWREMRVRQSGVVRFSEQPLLRGVNFFHQVGPFIAPITSALPPGQGGVYVNQGPQSVSVTWQSQTLSVQLVLRRDGAIDWVYDRIGPQPFIGQRGISPGGNLPFRRSFGTPLLLQREGTVLVEDSDFANRLIVHKTVARSVYCILGSALFILIVFPLFFRVSLVNPLDALLKGVDQLDEGRRDFEIPVTFNDEIGRLTGNFNRMTRSLKAAEDELKAYAESLEVKVKERTAELAHKNEENERLLLNILPRAIADRLKHGEGTIADTCPEATILFADIVGFTDLSTRLPASGVVELLNDLISEFDHLAREHGVEKIKTIGDAYMAVAGLPEPRSDHAEAAARLALGMLEAAEKRRPDDGGKPLQLRIGINSGSVIAGVIGTHKFAYDLWGDAVNTAARMESHGQPGHIQVTEATYSLLQARYRFEARREIEVKGKGRMGTYFLVPPDQCRGV